MAENIPSPPGSAVPPKKETGKVVMTRPLFPYPAYAMFKGSGDTNSADSFEVKR